MKMWMRGLMAVVLLAMLSGCGGGGGGPTGPDDGDDNTTVPVVDNDDGNSTAAASRTGVFLDSKVAGVRYETSSGVKGVTNAKGEYQYNDGDTVKFYVGNLKVGDVQAKDIVTVFDLENSTQAAILLQTLDKDGNPNNGIQISKKMNEQFINSGFTIQEIDPRSEEFNKKFKNIAGKDLNVDNDKATNHAFNTLKRIVINDIDNTFFAHLKSNYYDHENYQNTGFNPKDFMLGHKAKIRVYFMDSLIKKLIDSSIETSSEIQKNHDKTNEYVAKKLETVTDAWTQALGIISLSRATKNLYKGVKTLKEGLKLLPKIPNGTQLKLTDMAVAATTKKAINELFDKTLGTARNVGLGLAAKLLDVKVLKYSSDCFVLIEPAGRLRCIARTAGEIGKAGNEILYTVKNFQENRKIWSNYMVKFYLKVYYMVNAIDYPDNMRRALNAMAKANKLDKEYSFTTYNQNNQEDLENALDMLMEIYGKSTGMTTYDYNFDFANTLLVTYQEMVRRLTQNMSVAEVSALENLDDSGHLLIKPYLMPEEAHSNQYSACIEIENNSNVDARGLYGTIEYSINNKLIGKKPIALKGNLSANDFAGSICSALFTVEPNLLSNDLIKVKYNIHYVPDFYGAPQKDQAGMKYYEINKDEFLRMQSKVIVKPTYPHTVFEGQKITVNVMAGTLDMGDFYTYSWEILQGNLDIGSPNPKDHILTFKAPEVEDGKRYDKVTLRIGVTSRSYGKTTYKQITIKVLPRKKKSGSDETAPIITILGENPATVKMGESYTDQGAEAYDDHDGETEVTVESSGVDTSKKGLYKVVYTATDKAGNKAEKFRLVKVIDDTAPEIKAVSVPLSSTLRDTCYSYTQSGCEAVVFDLDKSYTKTWTFTNVGNRALNNVKVVSLEQDSEIDLKVVKSIESTIEPGDQGLFSIELTLPDDLSPGVHKGHFKLIDNEGDVNYITTKNTAYFWYMIKVPGEVEEPTLQPVSVDKSTFTFKATFNNALAKTYEVKISRDDGHGNWQSPDAMIANKNRTLFAKAYEITAPGNYRYRVAVFKGENRMTSWVEGDYQVGSVTDIPQNVKAQENNDGSVTVSWDPAKNASSYTLMRSLDGTYNGDYESIKNIKDTHYTFPSGTFLDNEILYFSVGVSGGEQSEKVSIIYANATNQPPTANAGADQQVASGATVTLDGSGSSDSDGQIVSYVWTENGTQVGTGVSLALDNVPDGVHTYTLTVMDDGNAMASDSVVVTVGSSDMNLSQGLVAHYEFEGNANDSSGNGNNGIGYGINYKKINNNMVAEFNSDHESRLQMPYSFMPTNGSLVMNINIKNGYKYRNHTFMDDQECALIFTTDIQGGDVTWPGSAWLYVCNNGDITFHIAGEKYESGWNEKYKLVARDTTFKFNRWHQIGVNYGVAGKNIYLDGVLIASNATQSQELGAGGNHNTPVDIPTIGESVSGFWGNNNYEGSFNGLVDEVRIYNRALNESEIKALYEIGNIPDTPAIPSNLKKTGQTIIYDVTGNTHAHSEADSNVSLRDDGYYQTGVDTNYTRDDSNEVVIDHVTGLMWQDNSEVNSSKKKWLTLDMYNQCTNDESRCFDTTGDTAATYCTNLNLHGITGWRLPTSDELMGIMVHSKREPSIDPIFQIHIDDNWNESYWSSTSHAQFKTDAWAVWEDDGWDSRNIKIAEKHVRCVKVFEQVNEEEGIDRDSQGIVSDKRTGLQWQDNYDDNNNETKYLSWHDAIRYCEDLELGGHTDWRLPNINELYSLVDKNNYDPAINTKFVHVDVDSNNQFWSSTTLPFYDERDGGMHVNFEEGRIDSWDDKTTENLVRCVRTGE